MQRKICPSCHAEIEVAEGSSKCPKCGADLPTSGVTLSGSYTAGEAPNQVNQQHVAQEILSENKKQTNPNTAFVVGIIVVVVVVVALVAAIFGSSLGNGDSANTSTSSVSSTVESSTESSVESSAESSAAAVVSADESSAESSQESSVESSAAESSVESSAAESSAAESSDEANEGRVITVEKPDDWGDIYCYIYTKEPDMINNGEWPGEELIATNGEYKYTIPENFGDRECYVIFSTNKRANGSSLSKQYPYSGKEGFAVSEKSNFTVADFEAYAEANK